LGKNKMFDRPWPPDLPSSCPNCGKEFHPKVNLSIGPGKVARILKAISYGMIVPWMIIAVILFASFGMPNGGRSGGYAIIGIIFIPPAIIAFVSVLFPGSRRIFCSCGWSHDYTALPKNTEAQQDAP
jgi:hypothetical protein